MRETDILDLLSEKKSIEEIQSELNVNKKKLKRKLKSMLNDEIIESDGNYYWKKSEHSVRIQTSYISVIILIAIVLIGFYLRCYHIDYPVVGYHNWKETHYLTEARNFAREGFFKYGFFVPAWDYPFLDSDPSGAHSDTFPTISIIVAIFFMIFGPELFVARLVGILFNTGAIVMMYLLVRKLFEREDLALVSALLTATLPLFVFFSHNVDLINLGLFFMLSSGYFYLRWGDSFKGKELVLTVLFLTLAVLTKYPFLIIAIPIFLTVPFKRLVELKRGYSVVLISILIFSLIPLWFFYSNYIISERYGTKAYSVTEGMIKFDVLLESQWWKTQEAYARDNYTLLGLFIAFLGLILLIFLFLKEKRFGERFILFYFLGAIPFTTVMAYKIGGHSYHQYPVAPLVIILMAYFIVRVSDVVKVLKIEGKEVKQMSILFKIIIIVILLALFAPGFQESISRQFDTQFIGLDVAGEYIKAHSNESERIMFPSHQSYGILWHADRKGFTPSEVDRIKLAEEKGATWMFVYDWGYWDRLPFPCQDPEDEKCQEEYMKKKETFDYLMNNYGMEQRAVWRVPKRCPTCPEYSSYILLKKGGKFDLSELNDLAILLGRVSVDDQAIVGTLRVHDKEVKHRDYEYTGGILRMYYVDIEE